MAFPDSTSSAKNIVRASNPRGIFLEGVIGAGITPKPGTIMQIDVSEGRHATGGFTFELYNRDADGNRPAGPLCILTEAGFFNQGRDSSQAFAAGDRCKVYVPVAGEELYALISDIAGTADDHSFGEMLIVDDGTGELIATTGTPESEPFMLLEDITDPEADTLAIVMYTGY